MLRILSVSTCFLLTGCTSLFIVKGVRINNAGRETIHCVTQVNQNAVSPELNQKIAEFCKSVEGAPVK